MEHPILPEEILRIIIASSSQLMQLYLQLICKKFHTFIAKILSDIHPYQQLNRIASYSEHMIHQIFIREQIKYHIKQDNAVTIMRSPAFHGLDMIHKVCDAGNLDLLRYLYKTLHSFTFTRGMIYRAAIHKHTHILKYISGEKYSLHDLDLLLISLCAACKLGNIRHMERLLSYYRNTWAIMMSRSYNISLLIKRICKIGRVDIFDKISEYIPLIPTHKYIIITYMSLSSPELFKYLLYIIADHVSYSDIQSIRHYPVRCDDSVLRLYLRTILPYQMASNRRRELIRKSIKHNNPDVFRTLRVYDAEYSQDHIHSICHIYNIQNIDDFKVHSL